MNRYDNMVIRNKTRSPNKTDKAVKVIRKMVENNEEVTVAKLVAITNFSRAFFYNNQKVHEELENARHLQDGNAFASAKKKVFDKALDAEVKLLRKTLDERDAEIAMLKNALKQSTKNIIADL